MVKRDHKFIRLCHEVMWNVSDISGRGRGGRNKAFDEDKLGRDEGY